MRRLRSLWGVGLCLGLGLAGCASAPQRLTPGPGGGPGTLAVRVLPTPPCGCQSAPVLTPPPSPGAMPRVASRATSVASRFFPAIDEPDAAAVDPLEPVRPDPLGVRTTLPEESARDREVSVPSDFAMLRAATAGGERESEGATTPPVPVVPVPLTVTVGAPRDATTAPATSPEPMPEPEPGPSLSPPDGNPAGSGPGPAPGRGASIGLEYVEDPALAGRPRLAHDGTLMPRPRAGAAADPVRYGPDPTFPAAYHAYGNAPTSVPKTREVWPTAAGPARPSLLSRLFQRFRKAGGPSIQAQRPPAPASAPVIDPTMRPLPMPWSTRGEPRDIAERGEGVERIAADRFDEAP